MTPPNDEYNFVPGSPTSELTAIDSSKLTRPYFPSLTFSAVSQLGGRCT
jgi:hypothetical protein